MMDRLISADALLDRPIFCKNRDTEYPDRGITSAVCEIIDAPTVEAIPMKWLTDVQGVLAVSGGPKEKKLAEAIGEVMQMWAEEHMDAE